MSELIAAGLAIPDLIMSWMTGSGLTIMLSTR